MADADLVQLIKRISVEATKTGKPCDYYVGTVLKEDPLTIKVSESVILEEDFLHLARNVTDYVTELTLEETLYTEEASLHRHEVRVVKKKFTVHNALKKGERVLMLRKAGGQEFTVIDRVVS